MPRFAMKQPKDTIFFKKSSLAVQIYKDDKNEVGIYFYNRRTNSIIGYYRIPLMEHCRNSLQTVDPIKKPRKKRKEYVPVGRRND